MKLSKPIRLATVLFLIASVFVLAVGCGDDDDDDGGSTGSTGSSPTATTAAGDSSVSGTISIEGSSTVQPFTLELIPEFQKAYPNVKVNPPSGLGSGAGITAFINKEVDIAQASRAIKQDEIDQAKAAGLDPFETEILKDALAIVVHPDNKVADLTEEEVAKIFAGEITNWSEVGGDNAEITVYTRNEESGTFAYMEEDVIQKILGKEAEYAADINKQASAPAGLSAVAGDEDGIFYAGLGNLSEVPSGSVKVLKIAGSGAAVEPSEATVADGSYPISRGLFYYTNGDPAKSDNKALGAFIDFALSDAGQAIGEGLGFLPASGSVGGSTGSTGGSPSSVTGTVSIEGSSTVQPFTLELIDLYNSTYPEAKVNPPSGLGSGAGITAFINKEVDIAQASRAIKQDEIDQAKAGGLDPFETEILKDALAIVVHPKNGITELTEEQVAKIFAGQITNWSEVGGKDAEITVYTRNEESGTFAYMEEDVIQKLLGKEAEYAADINKQASAPAGLSAVAGDEDGIFYAGLGNLSEIPAGSVKVLKVSGTSGAAVEPSEATVADGSYPISRGLFYYTNGDWKKSDNAALKAFIELALSEEGQAVGEELGFLPVTK